MPSSVPRKPSLKDLLGGLKAIWLVVMWWLGSGISGVEGLGGLTVEGLELRFFMGFGCQLVA